MAYDNVCKYLVEWFPESFARWLLGSPVSLAQLQPTELSTEPIRADSLILLRAQNLILHLEFQTDPDPDIPLAHGRLLPAPLRAICPEVRRLSST